VIRSIVAFAVGVLFAVGLGVSGMTRSRVDAPLILGAMTFGTGWGIGGFCPAPALVSLAGGAPPALAFVVAMVGSMFAHDAVERGLGYVYGRSARARPSG
jgi:uncharacterized membrane protein YedE/YeeE